MPAVSGIECSVGGLLYTGCPFNGWSASGVVPSRPPGPRADPDRYALTEIVRDLCDEKRYDVLPKVADALGYDLSLIHI